MEVAITVMVCDEVYVDSLRSVAGAGGEEAGEEAGGEEEAREVEVEGAPEIHVHCGFGRVLK